MARTNETRLRGTGFWDAVGYVLEENDRSDQEEEELRRPKMALEKKSSRRGWDVGSAQDRMVPWVMRSKGKADETFQRYYHLYRQGELEEDVVAVGGVVEESGYERDNWWAIFRRS